MMRTFHGLTGTCAVALTVVALAAACSKPAAPARATDSGTLIGGNPQATVSVKELMGFMIMPLADHIWSADYASVTRAGIAEHRPTTDEDWNEVMEGAIGLAEGIELLHVRRPFAPPGEVTPVGPAGPGQGAELTPQEMQAKVEGDPVVWQAKIQALHNVALEIMDLVKKKDADGLFTAGSDLDEACEACHLEYWYPLRSN